MILSLLKFWPEMFKSAAKKFGKWGIWPAEIMANRDIDAPVAWFELDLEKVAANQRTEVKYSPLPRFPISWRDIAVVVDEQVTAADLQTAIFQSGGPCLVKVEPFDVYRGEKLGAQKKSLAIRLEFSHAERSLESAEVEQWMSAILQELKTAHGAELR
jgi:phenylalanyl-tRNA synthetase beta chain